MNLSLDTSSETLIRQKVESGLYRDAGEVVREALRLLDERDRRAEALRAELRIGLDQVEHGELIDYTPELLEELSRQAEDDARDGKPIKDAVKP